MGDDEVMRNLKPLTLAVLIATAVALTATTASAAPRGDDSPARLQSDHEDIYYDFRLYIWVDSVGWALFNQYDRRGDAEYDAWILAYAGYEVKIIPVRESWWLRSALGN